MLMLYRGTTRLVLQAHVMCDRGYSLVAIEAAALETPGDLWVKFSGQLRPKCSTELAERVLRSRR